MSELGEAALQYAQWGWPVFPLAPRTKVPLPGSHGYKDATTDPERIVDWWTQTPDANIGIALGPAGLVVVDWDTEEAHETWRSLRQEHGFDDRTVTAVTSRGEHLYFDAGGRHINCGQLAPGLDVKGATGYAVAPPSIHPDGSTYAWDSGFSLFNLALLPVPDVVPKLLTASTPPPTTLEPVAGEVREGRRSTVLTSLAGTMRRPGMSEEAIAAALLVENESRCNPPLPEPEVRAIARSIARYPATVDVSRVTPTPDLLRINAAELREAGLSQGGEPDSLPFLGLSGYIIRGWAHLIAGYPKAGKTELLARLCSEWQSERILYLTEDPKGIWGLRLARLPGEWGHMSFIFALGAPVGTILQTISDAQEDVIMLDTVRNLLSIHDETDNSEVARVLNPVIAACRDTNKTLVMAHHMRKGGGEHGESITGAHAFLGVVDVALELRFGATTAQRQVRSWGRVITPSELVYEQADDLSFVPLGSPEMLKLDQVKGRLLSALNSGWQTSSDVLDALGEPKPGREQLRRALEELTNSGAVQRNPEQSTPGKTYRYRRSASPTALFPEVVGEVAA